MAKTDVVREALRWLITSYAKKLKTSKDREELVANLSALIDEETMTSLQLWRVLRWIVVEDSGGCHLIPLLKGERASLFYDNIEPLDVRWEDGDDDVIEFGNGETWVDISTPEICAKAIFKQIGSVRAASFPDLKDAEGMFAKWREEGEEKKV